MTPVCELDIALLDADAKLVVAEKEKALLGKVLQYLHLQEALVKSIMQISEQNVFENNLFSLGF